MANPASEDHGRHDEHRRDESSSASPPTTGSSRRTFLTQAAAMTAAAAFLSGCTDESGAIQLQARQIPVPKSAPHVKLGADAPVRIGIIGTGGMGTGHCEAICNMAKKGRVNAQIVALCDVNSKRLGEALKKVKSIQGDTVDVQTYRYADDLLKRNDIHACLAAVPEHWHHDMAMKVISAGKDLYLEKPMTFRFDDALHLHETVRANPDLVFQVGTQYMMYPKYHKAKEIIDKGGIGKPTFSQTSYCRNSKDGEWLYYYIDPEVVPGPVLDWEEWCRPLGPHKFDGAVYAQWRRYKTWSTGIVGDLLVHMMTPLMLAIDAGWPTRVTAAGGHYVDKKMENHDQVNMAIEFEKEHTMIVAGSTCNDVGLESMIRGHKATMYLNSNNVVIRPQSIFADEVEEQTVKCDDIGDPQDALRANWIECVRTRQPVVSGIELATKMMVAVGLATMSMWQGCAFEFDPKTMKAHKAI